MVLHSTFLINQALYNKSYSDYSGNDLPQKKALFEGIKQTRRGKPDGVEFDLMLKISGI